MRRGGEGYFENVNVKIEQLKRRQQPKKASSRPKKYLVDDAGKYFEYGFERHARVETVIPPHLIQCGLNSEYRFGRRFDRERHFNVSLGRDERLTFTFADCHGGAQPRSEVSHANIFPNDFVV